MNKPSKKITLVRKLDRVFIKFGDSDKEVPVKLVWTRPVSGKGQEVSIIGKEKKEILMLKDLNSLDQDSRKIAEEELEKRYLIPRITQVIRTHASFGNRYWDVQTDRGHRKFAMKDPRKNVIWVTNDQLIIRDTLGNRYEIESFSRLDTWSKAEVEKVT